MKRLDAQAYVDGVRGGDRAILARAITLIESEQPAHARLAQQVLEALLPATGGACRIGISGVPGAGKSTFIEALGQALGGTVVRAPEPMHGKLSAINHTGSGVFKDLATPFQSTRYHSLVIERESLPDCLDITAETDDGIIMGLEHRTLPLHGVQFHPESIASENGHRLLQNFLSLSSRKKN